MKPQTVKSLLFAIGCTLMFTGVATGFDTLTHLSPEVNKFFVHDTNEIALPSSFGFALAGAAFILIAMTSGNGSRKK
ncbi:MAG: hypothetical protein IPN69_08390 [Acidobacteria bacterium]|nr:hypothetical protein [Acidobacteriota bacterium]